MKLLTICIPTYKRPDTLRYCIDSIVAQIEKYALKNYIGIYVANDASPDDTANVLEAYHALSYFDGVSRKQNLGMNVNIKTMLAELADKSTYQLIITDDDYLQPDILGELNEFLLTQQASKNGAPAIWTPRFSYLENGDLHCVVCNPFKDSCYVRSSVVNAGRYMSNGFVLSGLILQAECIDFAFWEQYKENGFFPMILLGDLLFRHGGYYWNRNVVHHTVLNKCHWERWGKNDVVIATRLSADYVNAYGIMAERIGQFWKATLFYCTSFASISRHMKGFLVSEKFTRDKQMALDAIHELKAQGTLGFNPKLRILMIFALPVCTVLILKSILRLLIGLLIPGSEKNERRRIALSAHIKGLRFMPIGLKVIFF